MPTDDRAYLQGLLDATAAGDVCQLPSGPWYVGQAGSAYYALTVPAGVTVRGAGAGTTILQMPGAAEGVRLFQMAGAGAVLDRLTLDGNASAQTGSTFQRHGTFVTAADCVLRNVTTQNFAGDGLYLYTGSDRALVDGCTATSNLRNGITLAGGTGLTVRGGLYSGNTAQQVDSEPGSPLHVDDVTIADVTITGSTGNYALTVSGSGSAYRSRGWRVTGCTILGSVHVVWADDVLIASNTITNGSDKAGIDVYRSCDGVTIARNTIACSRTDVGYQAGVYILGIGTGQAPSNVTVVDNAISVAGAQTFGVRAQGCLSVGLYGNALTGSGLTNTLGAGVYMRATNLDVPFALAQLVGNTIAGFGNRGISIAGNSTAQLAMFRAVGNTIGDTGTVQSIGMILDDGSHPLQSSDISGNSYGSGVTSGRL